MLKKIIERIHIHPWIAFIVIIPIGIYIGLII